MGQINVNIRMDENLKKEFEFLLDDMGLSMTSAFNIFAKAVVREKKIPFEIKSNLNYIKIEQINDNDIEDNFVTDILGNDLINIDE